MKKCIICKEKEVRSNDSSYCRTCHNEYQKEHYRKNPKSITESAKKRSFDIKMFVRNAKDKPCEDCGIKYPYYVMDLDHKRGEKKFNLSTASTKMYSLKTIKEEIEKCDVVCSNCHRERTWKHLIK